MLLALLVIMGRSVAAKSPSAVGLTYFRATPLDNEILLSWHTETEINTAAFIIKRAPAGSNNFVWLENLGSQGYIFAEGGPAFGEDYEVTDTTVTNGETYTYKLFEIETDMDEVELATLTVTVGIPTQTATSTPIVLTGGHNAPSPTPTSAQPTVGETATITPIPPITDSTSSPPTDVPPSPPSPTPTDMPAIPTPTAVSAPPTATSISPSSQPNASTFQPASSSTQPTTESDSFSVQIAAAQSEPEATTDSAYPGPNATATATATTSPESAYPAVVKPSEELYEEPTAYPAAESPPISIIGSQSDDLPALPIESLSSGNAVVGRIYLWVGFIVALLIFAGSVVGSILLFTRKRE